MNYQTNPYQANSFQNNAYLNMLQQYGQPIKTDVIRVNGRNGAEAINLAPNSSIFLADNTNQDRIWLCITDGAGYKTVRAIRGIFEDTEESTVTLEERISRLEKAIEEINSRNVKRRKSDECEGQQRLPGVDIIPNQ